MTSDFVRLAQHLRYCTRCHDVDVPNCPTGLRLWSKTVGSLDVPYPLVLDAGDTGGDDVSWRTAKSIFPLNG